MKRRLTGSREAYGTARSKARRKIGENETSMAVVSRRRHIFVVCTVQECCCNDFPGTYRISWPTMFSRLRFSVPRLSAASRLLSTTHWLRCAHVQPSFTRARQFQSVPEYHTAADEVLDRLYDQFEPVCEAIAAGDIVFSVTL